MPQRTFNIATGTDDQFVENAGTVYVDPLSGTATVYNLNYVSAARYFSTPNFFVDNGLLRWNTSGLGSAAVVSSAFIRAYTFPVGNDDTRSLTADYYTWSAVSGDYIQTAQTGAISGITLSSITNSSYNDFPLSSVSGVSTTGITYIRLHVSGTQPTGTNFVHLASSEFGGGLIAPQLIVTYTLNPVPPDSLISSSGFTGSYTDAVTDDANWLIGV